MSTKLSDNFTMSGIVKFTRKQLGNKKPPGGGFLIPRFVSCFNPTALISAESVPEVSELIRLTVGLIAPEESGVGF